MLCDEYYERVLALQSEVYACEKQGIIKAAGLIARSVAGGGILHIFGCGHSHIMAEEAFYRAGGMVAVNPILDSAVMLHEGAVKSSAVERMSGYAGHIFDRFEISPGDVMLIYSTSGINPLPIDMARHARHKGMCVIVVTSSAYAGAESRDLSGKRLSDYGDIVIDNHAPYGDAVIEAEGVEGGIMPCSTILGALILNMMISQTAEELLKLGAKPKFFMSGNIPGGAEHNRQYIEEYRSRIRML